MVLGFERILRSFVALRIGKLHFVVVGPILDILLILIQTLTSRLLVISLLHCPVKLVRWVTGELGQLGSVHSQDLLSKLVSHVLDHLLSSSFLENLLIHCNHILFLKC